SLAQGATNRDVATELHLSPHTVKTHVRNAFAKLGITSRAQLAQLMRGADRSTAHRVVDVRGLE
ncbi:response regulator transcription factor, partial [Mycobacterium sp. 1165178.9]|uniref:response regulator transcription factor n=1 Tax=Mycobacterium sp. 1165178.9 TaxID=1834070 RepID=UPI000A91516F